MIDLALTPAELQEWLDVFLTFLKDPIVLAILASVFGLPFLSPAIREKTGLQKPKQPKNEE